MRSDSNTFRVVFVILGWLLSSCGGPLAPQGDGGTPDGSIPIVGTGTPGNPIVLAERVRVTSPVTMQAGATIWYRVDLAGDGPFVLLTEDVPYSVALEVHGTPDLLSPTLQDCSGGPGANVCTLVLAPGRYYVSGTYVPILASSPYHLTYFQLDPDGTAQAPVLLPPNAPARWSAVTSDAASYYEFVADVSGAYMVRLDTPGGYTAATTIEVFANADFSTTPIESCFYTSSPSGCSLSGLPAGTYGIRATPAWAGAQLVQASVIQGFGRGALGDYVPMTGGTHQGGVDSWSQSYYSFTTDSGPAGSYVFSFASPSAGHIVRIYEDDTGSAVFVGQCPMQTAPCEIGGLDSTTTYYVRIPGSAGVDEAFTLSYAKGTFEGSQNQPATLVLESPRDVPIGDAVTSFFRFTTTSSGPYEIRVEPIDPTVTYEPFFGIYEDIELSVYNSTCNAIPCVTKPLDANREYYFAIDSFSTTALRITVRRAPAGEGSAADPVPLPLGVAHQTTFSDGNTSYYSYTTGATPPSRITIFARLPTFATWPTVITPALTQDCQSSFCIYSGIQPNTTYNFSFANYGGDVPAVVRIIDMSGALPCDANAASCIDFEAGAPVTTQPAYSVDNWTLDSGVAAYGAQSFLCGNMANNGERTCFTYVAPGVTSTVIFNLREVTDAASGLTVFANDGAFISYVDAPLVSGQWRRAIAYAAPLADRAWTFCYRKDGTGGLLDTAWLDDIQFE